MKKMKFVVLFVLLVFATSASVASAALVSQYTFDDGTYNDYVGGHNGTAVGNAHIDTGYLHLDNTVTRPHYVDCNYFDILNPANNAFTLAAWVDPDLAWATTKDMPIVQKGDEFGIKFKANDTLECYFQSSQTGNYWYWANVGAARIAEIWADGKFHLVTGTYDPTVAQLKLYVDGVLEAFNTGYTGSVGWVVGDTIMLSTRNWNIGRDSKKTDNSRMYTGLIDDVRIYDNALTAEEVRAIPEPATIALLGLGALSLLRRKR